ncbi:unnamed protein product [Heterobilharzia americana]|nr:unnamed protein product [Heterobilharzia americana]
MPVPCSLTKVNSDAIGTTSKIRLLCSLSGGENPPVWEDITGSTPMTIHKDCVSFTTTVSARLWLIDCPAGMPVTDLATRIYNESTEPPILGRFIVYARQSTDLDTAMQPGTPEIQSRHSSNVQDLSRNISRIRRSATEFAQIRCLCLTDDTEDKTLECLENYYQIATGPFVEIQQNKPIWIEMIGNLVPVLKSGEQLKFIIRPFYENRITFPVRLREVPDRELNLNMITGKIAFMRESRTVQTTEDSANIQTQRPITVLEFKLPSPDQAMMLSTRESDVVGRSDMDRRKLALEIGEDWRRLASLLGFSEQDIKMIDRIPPNAISAASGLNIEHQRAETLLTLWKHRAASSGLTDRDALGSHLADALNKINRSDAFHPSMTNIRPVSTKEEIITANAVLENRSTLPMVVEEKSHFTPNKILMSLKQEIQDTFPSMKYQEVEDMQEQDSEPVLSWSEKDFLSSDEGVSTISVSGIKDGVQKSKAIVNHPAFRNDIKSFVTENLPVKTPVEQEIIPEDKIYSIVTDINETSPINRQSVSFRVGLLTKPNQMVAQGNEEPDGLIKEVFIKSTAHHIEQISPPTDRKHVQHIAQELAEVLGHELTKQKGASNCRKKILLNSCMHYHQKTFWMTNRSSVFMKGQY